MLTSLYRLADLARHQGRRRSWDADLATGRRGEDIAHRFLQRMGMMVVARNHRTGAGTGEVDLIGWDREHLVFVEVKTRTTVDYGPPERAVGADKQRKIINAARDYVRRANIPWTSVRFDIVTVVLDTPPSVMHHKDAFSVGSPLSA
jgi:putative endonuclease